MEVSEKYEIYTCGEDSEKYYLSIIGYEDNLVSNTSILKYRTNCNWKG